MTQRIEARQEFPTTATNMREWDNLVPTDWNKFVDNMPERIAQLKKRKGMQT